jgi:hypothetical protein
VPAYFAGDISVSSPIPRTDNPKRRGLSDSTGKIRRLKMADSPSSDGVQIIEVTFNQQQYVIIERLKAEGQFGRTDEEIVRNIFLEFLRQEGV